MSSPPAPPGASAPSALWMRPGDIVEVEIDTLGILRNPIAAEA